MVEITALTEFRASALSKVKIGGQIFSIADFGRREPCQDGFAVCPNPKIKF